MSLGIQLNYSARVTRSQPPQVTGYRNDGVGTAVALVNAATADATADAAASATELAELLRDFRFLVDEPLDEATAGQLRDWARQLRAVFTAADQPAAIAALNTAMGPIPIHPHISDHGLGPHLHYGPPGAGLLDRVRANTAMGLAFTICGYGAERLGVCKREGCARVYADISRGPRRTYCGKSCLNRETVAAYRARRAGGH